MTVNRQAPTIAVAGDWHGNTAWALSVLDVVAESDIDLLLHLGDFGYWPGASGKRFLDAVNRRAAEHGIDIWVSPGNHEWWSELRRIWDEEPAARDGDGRELPLQLADHITMLPRGWRFTLTSDTGGPVSFISLGGAPSIDFTERRQDRDWWPQEAITTDDLDLVAAGGYADVMLTHDAPGIPWATDAVARILANDRGWTTAGLAYAREGTQLMTRAFTSVAPRWLFHGHFHVADQTTVHLPGVDYPTRIVSLDCDGTDGNVLLIDLDILARNDRAGDPVTTRDVPWS